jgi:hypothetical protein
MCPALNSIIVPTKYLEKYKHKDSYHWTVKFNKTSMHIVKFSSKTVSKRKHKGINEEYKLNCRNIEGYLNCLQEMGRKNTERKRSYFVGNSDAQWDCVIRS